MSFELFEKDNRNIIGNLRMSSDLFEKDIGTLLLRIYEFALILNWLLFIIHG